MWHRRALLMLHLNKTLEHIFKEIKRDSVQKTDALVA